MLHAPSTDEGYRSSYPLRTDQHMRPSVLGWVFVGVFAGCASASTPDRPDVAPADSDSPNVAIADGPLFDDPFPSTYQPFASEAVVIRGATVLTGVGSILTDASVVLADGKIAAVGTDVAVPSGARVIEGSGLWVTPGLIDTHSHLGVYPSPGVSSVSDGNEATNPNTAEVWAEHSIWPHDPGFGHAVAGGVTALQILPGSANLFGGRSVTVKPVPARSYQAMKFPGAPHGLKIACGENPKRVYQARGPATRMANVAGYRAAWIRAERYLAQWTAWRAEGSAADSQPARDLQLETLAGVLNGDILVHNHCYRGDEMVTMIDLAEEFGYSIASFHHAVEAYKVRDILAEEEICGSLWSDWWGFKLEAYDGILENVALLHEAGGCAIVHSDDAHGIQRLNVDAAKAMTAGNRRGMDLDRTDAIQWITLNAARALGIDDVTGSLEVGKNADVVVWSGDPFSIYSKANLVFVDGALLYDRSNPNPLLMGDFMHGIVPGGSQ